MRPLDTVGGINLCRRDDIRHPKRWGPVVWAMLVFLWTGMVAAKDTATIFLGNTRSQMIAGAALKSTRNWPLPPAGPPGLPDKTIVFIGEDFRNAGILGVGAGVQEAAKAMGWQVRFLDIGTKDAQRGAVFQRAMQLRPDGIVLGGMDAAGNANFLTPFADAGIPIVGWHVAPLPGPVEKTPIRVNVATDSIEVAKAAAHYAIARSNGKAGVVIFTDSRFAIAMKKADIMAQIIKACAGCSLLEIVDLPLDKAGSMMPGVTERLLLNYGKSWQYSLAINDLYFDHCTATLVMNGHPPQGPPANISAGDGSPSALMRIRYEIYQEATIAEPLIFQGWQIVDELNRAMQGQPPSGYQTPPKIITKDNLRPGNGCMALFDPENGYRLLFRKIWNRE